MGFVGFVYTFCDIMARTDPGVPRVSIKPPKFNLKIRHYETLTWPEKARNPFSEDLNLSIFRVRMPSLPLPPPTGEFL